MAETAAGVYIRYYVKEPAVWVENRKRQREHKQEVRAPLLTIFKPALLINTLTACWWLAGTMVVYYSIYGLFATWLQRDLKLAAAVVATPILLADLASQSCRLRRPGVLGLGRRWHWPALGDDHPGDSRMYRGTGIPAYQ
jgi:MFS transporter, SHS family, lactate transporter